MNSLSAMRELSSSNLEYLVLLDHELVMKIIYTKFVFPSSFLATKLPSSGSVLAGPVVACMGPGSSQSTCAPVNLAVATEIVTRMRRDFIFEVDSLSRYEGGKMNRSPYVQATPDHAIEIKAEDEAKVCRAEK